MEKQHNGIAMVKDILDYLNNYEVQVLLELNKTKRTEIETMMGTIPEAKWEKRTVTVHRELMSIRQSLLARLGLPGEKDSWKNK
jgi:hypothetical protein